MRAAQPDLISTQRICAVTTGENVVRSQLTDNCRSGGSV